MTEPQPASHLPNSHGRLKGLQHMLQSTHIHQAQGHGPRREIMSHPPDFPMPTSLHSSIDLVMHACIREVRDTGQPSVSRALDRFFPRHPDICECPVPRQTGSGPQHSNSKPSYLLLLAPGRHNTRVFTRTHCSLHRTTILINAPFITYQVPPLPESSPYVI